MAKGTWDEYRRTIICFKDGTWGKGIHNILGSKDFAKEAIKIEEFRNLIKKHIEMQEITDSYR